MLAPTGEMNFQIAQKLEVMPKSQDEFSDVRGDYSLIPSQEPFSGSTEATSGDQQPSPEDFAMRPSRQLPPRGRCACGLDLLQNTCFQSCEALLIIGNAIVIGMETDMKEFKHWNEIENSFLLVFLIELIFKVIVIGPTTYFDIHDNDFIWNFFDFLIVALGCSDAISLLLYPESGGGGGFATIFRMIRLLRILRIFRIVKFLKELYVLAFGLVEAVKAVFWVTVLMFFVLYVCSIVLVKTIGSTDPDDMNYEFVMFRYGCIKDSMLTLFVLMSSPNFVIYEDEEGLIDNHPYFGGFLVMFITFGSFGMIALLTGVISESMFQKNEVRKEQARIEQEEMKRMIMSKCEILFSEIDPSHFVTSGCEEVTTSVLVDHAQDMCNMLAACGIQFSMMDMLRIIEFMDVDGTGLIGVDEFVKSMLKVADGISPMSMQELQHSIGNVDRKVDKVQASLEQGMATMQDKMLVIQQQLVELTRAVQAR